MKIVKHSGSVVEFNRDKLKSSLLKSGASSLVVEDILKAIDHEIYEGITTKKIYKLAFGLLKKSSNSIAARYNLRDAIQMLGPTGFFFEKFISRLFVTEGYTTTTNFFLQGKCVSHEVDVLIKKNDFVEMIECKFHPRRETNSDVKVPMYILSRFNDLKDRSHPIFTKSDKISNCWIVTNNRFTSDAMDFANCSGLKLMSWDYPPKFCLRKKIDEDQLYPITCLTTLTIAEKDKLMVSDIILAQEIIDKLEILEKIGLSPIRIKNVIKEASELCKYL
ncbi:restriction endonuclease [Flavobacterium paronense]|uniref:Restriction endonuclease n=1 Tax=Flavobacterium paronense TaxID=1392775 RepID=A0ABV5GCT8_9FLAO|nr:ATP cone domain-containing protein [Flavobacterium paronense]MDN3676236.1 restriction endonuclease [Flavobacterium paronense]